jgi:membrane-associated phospholipid phosphatase
VLGAFGKWCVSSSVAVAWSASFSIARAEDHELERAGASTLAIELGAAAALATGIFLLPNPELCRWCVPPAFDEALHTPLPRGSRRTIAAVSHGISFALLPLGAFSTLVLQPLSSGAPDRHAGENGAIFAQAFLVNAVATVGVKKWVGRRRPAFFYKRASYTEFGEVPHEPNLSFFSGDTSAAFVSASALSTIAFSRGYAAAPYLAVGGGTLALTTGLMRIGADVHWPSDVFVGALVGTAIGVVWPVFLHPRRDRPSGRPAVEQPLTLFNLGGAF